MTTTTEKTARAAKEGTGFEAMAAFSPDSFKDGYEKFAEGVSTVADFQKASIEAFMASAGALAKGVERMTSEQTAFLKSAYENGMATAKAASSSKSVQEAFEINSEFVRDSLEKNLGQVSKVADLWIETAKQTAEPLTARYSEMVEKVQSYRP